MKSNVVLIGFMGCGKTAVGKRISSYLNYRHIDTDDYIVKKAGMSISEIFARFGENYFRGLENEVSEEISRHERCVISTGGGIVKNEQNMSALKRNGTTVYLKSSPDKIFENTKNQTNRPLLNTENRLETIEKLLAQREPLYLKYADITVDTENLTVQAAANEICKLLSELT